MRNPAYRHVGIGVLLENHQPPRKLDVITRVPNLVIVDEDLDNLRHAVELNLRIVSHGHVDLGESAHAVFTVLVVDLILDEYGDAGLCKQKHSELENRHMKREENWRCSREAAVSLNVV